MIMTFVRKVKKESKLLTGFPTLNMRLPSLCMQALSLGYSTVWANRAGGQSTIRLWLITSPQERTAFPVNREFLLNLLNSISLNSIIQGAGHAREPPGRGYKKLLSGHPHCPLLHISPKRFNRKPPSRFPPSTSRANRAASRHAMLPAMPRPDAVG